MAKLMGPGGVGKACGFAAGEPFTEVLAPNIDRFRRANMSMDRCISNYPLCCPYRAIMTTGKYSPENGVTNNAVAMRLLELTLSKAFRRAGYRTSYVGKLGTWPGITIYTPNSLRA